MEIGFGAPVSGAWATPQNLAAFAVAAETAGYSSLWSFQRLLIPVGSSIEPVYHSVLDPMAALSFAAAVTSRIRLGVAVINLPFVSPGYLAKQSASVDVLSGGRHDLGLGIGWMPEEFALTGAEMARRGARTAEYVQVLRALWSGGAAAYDGEFYRVPGRHAGASTRPARRPADSARRAGQARPGANRPPRGWLGHVQPDEPGQDRRAHRGRERVRRRGRPRPRRHAGRLPRRGAGGLAGDR